MHNDILPRYWTTQEIHRKIRLLYNQRHSIFESILFPSEENRGLLMDYKKYIWPDVNEVRR
jgi:hypothetical protein